MRRSVGWMVSALLVVATAVPAPAASAAAHQPGALQTGALQTGALQTGALQTGALQTGALQTGALQTGALQTGALQTGALQAGALQAGALAGGPTELSPSGGESRALAVNARGEVVGSGTPGPDTGWGGQLWSPPGYAPEPLPLGITARAINDLGDVVGCTADGVGLLWRHATLSRVSRAGQWICFSGLNDAGQVIGSTASRAGGPATAFVWQDGQFTDLPTPAGRATDPVGISANGQVVGRMFGATTSMPIRTVVWTDGRRADLGTLGGAEAVPIAINAVGEVIGTSTLANGHLHPFSWRDGRIVDLLAGTGVTDDHSSVRAVNDAGEIVGTVTGRPVIWAHGKLTYLAPATVTGEAVAINAGGEVTGVVRSAAGYQTVFRWRPGALTRLAGALTRLAGALTRLPNLPGADFSLPGGIDDQGRVVANVAVGPAGTHHAVVWN